MDTKINDGGPAFPNVYEDRSTPGQIHTHVQDGMSLRDWFAGMALQGMLCNGFMPMEASGCVGKTPYSYISASFELADAMLADREKGQP